MNLKDFKEKIKNLNWDDFMTIYKIRDHYCKDKQSILEIEHSKRASRFNEYMSF